MMGEYDAGYENYIDGLNREIIDYQIEVEQVKGENAKLRELVRIVFGRLQAAEDATDMGWIDARLLDRMKELGVDDG